ncbi:GNAT family N-acetyltransferase [Burkholderia vietnamiensis]|uniref:GNAT family N-acetyltransferase n=1 Tax=Burkholderia vietnamiensis TaxID=60552 RepID=UPI003D300669
MIFHCFFLLRESDTLIGCGGLHKPRWTARTFEVGWWGRTAFTGQGLITEAVRTILDFAFSSLAAHRVEALPDDLNEKKLATMRARRDGFRRYSPSRTDCAGWRASKLPHVFENLVLTVPN